MDVCQWMQVAVYSNEMWLASHCGHFIYKRKFGGAISKAEKNICGCICLGTFAFFLVGPLVMFSNAGFLTTNNLITDGALSLNIRLENESSDKSSIYSFELYEASSCLDLESMSEDIFGEYGFDTNTNTKFFNLE